MIRSARLIVFALFVCTFFTAAFAQPDKERIAAYISQYKDLAMSEMLRTGVPASITLAQGILETAGGQSDLASVANNHFGIKCKSNWTGESMLHNDDAKNECFRKYASVEDSYKDHSDFLKQRPNYAFLFKLDPTDYEGWAKGLKRAGYATSSTYAQALIKMIVENNLQQFSLLAMQRSDNRDDLFSTAGASVAAVEINNIDAPPATQQEEVLPQPVAKLILPKAELKKKNKNVTYPVNSVFSINAARVIYADAGTSMLALANNYNVALKKLMEFNDLEETDILGNSQLIFLEKKPKKGLNDIHIVEENETLHDIAQKEGIQLAVIMEYNNLKKGMQPAEGEKIYLKYQAPAAPRLATASVLKGSVSM